MSDGARTRPRPGPSAFSLPEMIAAEDRQELVGRCVCGGVSTLEHSDNTFQHEEGSEWMMPRSTMMGEGIKGVGAGTRGNTEGTEASKSKGGAQASNQESF